jgi:hypothetical protein
VDIHHVWQLTAEKLPTISLGTIFRQGFSPPLPENDSLPFSAVPAVARVKTPPLLHHGEGAAGISILARKDILFLQKLDTDQGRSSRLRYSPSHQAGKTATKK